VLFPDPRDVEAMVNRHGPNLFLQSVELRKECCRVRKVLPLRRELAALDAWVTGLRREQADTRIGLDRIEWDDANGLYKVNPLADWTTEQVWEYIRAHDVPYSRLHERGYPSIGCAPCTRAVDPGEDLRAGRWWWELPEHKECGLHWKDGKLVRKEG
jgi:phosphoadenosine phosphosulfate reductase